MGYTLTGIDVQMTVSGTLTSNELARIRAEVWSDAKSYDT